MNPKWKSILFDTDNPGIIQTVCHDMQHFRGSRDSDMTAGYRETILGLQRFQAVLPSDHAIASREQECAVHWERSRCLLGQRCKVGISPYPGKWTQGNEGRIQRGAERTTDRDDLTDLVGEAMGQMTGKDTTQTEAYDVELAMSGMDVQQALLHPGNQPGRGTVIDSEFPTKGVVTYGRQSRAKTHRMRVAASYDR